MICVSIGRGRHKHMIAEHKHLVEQGVELVELRLDYINGRVQLKRLLTDRPGPVVVTCRREQDGGKWTQSEQERQVLLRAAIAEGVEYIDLEEDIASDIPRFGSTKRIISLHDFRQTPEDLPALIRRLADLDADIVKVATMANHPLDNLRMLKATRESDVSFTGMCMGEMGTPSRILAGKYGAVFSYATFHHERKLAPGQLSYRQMTELYRYDSVNQETEVFGVIADPVGHSLSPHIHNAAFRETGLNKVYVPFRVPRDCLDDFLKACPELDVKGLSVTIPHKEAVIPHLNKVDGAVRGVRAANTIVFREGELLGFNTDYRAAMDCIDAAAKVEGEKSPLKGKTGLVLGSGGVARAIAFGLMRREMDVVVAGIEPQQAAELAKTVRGKAVPWEERHSVRPALLVNCTPVGMHPNVNATPYEKDRIPGTCIVFDAVYNPELTLLIKNARERGCRAITGVSMFVRQAALQFKHFTGVDPPLDVMREVLKRATGAVRVA